MDFRFVTKMLSFNPICVACVCASIIIWRRLYKTDKNNYKVTFFNPWRKSSCKCANKYNTECLNVDCPFVKTAQITYCMKNATKSIDICVFAVSNEQIALEVIAAHKRGVVVRIIICNCVLMHGKEITRFRNNGIELKFQNDINSYMHNKFCIVDSKWLIHGSMNWTRQATILNWESLLITDLPLLVSEFSNAFEYVWLNISSKD